jgi:hypothetical protein
MTTITIERALLEKIIEKFAACGCEVCTRQSIEALKAALAAPATAPEPVAWLAHYVGRSGMEQEYVSTDKNLADENDASGKALPLYLHPPATAPAQPAPERKPMTDDETLALFDRVKVRMLFTDADVAPFASGVAAAEHFHLMEINHETSPIPIPRQ